jgi:hypothetical protein
MSQNPNSNNNPQSGVAFTCRLSETVFAVILTAGVSFGGGLTVAKGSGFPFGNSHNQSLNCPAQTQSAP